MWEYSIYVDENDECRLTKRWVDGNAQRGEWEPTDQSDILPLATTLYNNRDYRLDDRPRVR